MPKVLKSLVDDQILLAKLVSVVVQSSALKPTKVLVRYYHSFDTAAEECTSKRALDAVADENGAVGESKFKTLAADPPVVDTLSSSTLTVLQAQVLQSEEIATLLQDETVLKAMERIVESEDAESALIEAMQSDPTGVGRVTEIIRGLIVKQ